MARIECPEVHCRPYGAPSSDRSSTKDICYVKEKECSHPGAFLIYQVEAGVGARVGVVCERGVGVVFFVSTRSCMYL